MSESKIGSVSPARISNIKGSLTNVLTSVSRLIEEVNGVQSLFYALDNNRGGVVSGTDSRYTLQPDFESETTVNPLNLGLDGTSIYTYSDSSEYENTGIPKYKTLSSLFYKIDPEDENSHRPTTVFETFINFQEWVNDSIAEAIESISLPASCITDCAYTKSIIGSLAFSPSGSKEVGSILWKLDSLENKSSQLKEDTMGSNYSYNGLASARSTYSLNDKVNALLKIHNGNEYVEWDTGAELDVSHDDIEGITPAKYVEFFNAQMAEFLVESTAGTLSQGNRPEYTVDVTLDDYYFLLEDTDLNAVPPHLPVIVFEDDGGLIARNSLCRWVIGLNSAYRETLCIDEGDPIPYPLPANADRSYLRLNQEDKGFNINLLYDYSKGQLVSGLIFDNNEILNSYIEITLHGRPVVSTDTGVIAKMRGTLADVSSLTYADLNGDNSTTSVILVPGPNKINIAQGISLKDFEFKVGYEASLFYSGDENQTHTIDYMTITLMHKAGSVIEAAYVSNEVAAAAEYGDPRVIGVELEWFDYGSDLSTGETVDEGFKIEATFTDGAETISGDLFETDTLLTATFTDGVDSVESDIGRDE